MEDWKDEERYGKMTNEELIQGLEVLNAQKSAIQLIAMIDDLKTLQTVTNIMKLHIFVEDECRRAHE